MIFIVAAFPPSKLVTFLSAEIHHVFMCYIYVIGHNGTINGQGQSWWIKFRKKLLNHTRGPLVQLMRSSNIVISNITLRDSPFWTLHLYDCKNVTISETTVLSPIVGAPNTDGIDPGHFPTLHFTVISELFFISAIGHIAQLLVNSQTSLFIV